MVEYRSAFARELRLARERLGLTIQQAADRAHVSASLWSKVENDAAPPSKPFESAASKLIAEGIDTTGLLDRLRQDGQREPAMSEPLRDWLGYEAQATFIRWFEPLLVPGLLQTEAYARAVLRNDSKVRARMERQALLTREEPPPPELAVIVSEAVLRHPMAAPIVMAEQLEYLTTAPATVRVLPTLAAIGGERDGGFVLATIGDRAYAYGDAAGQGRTVESREIVSLVQLRWEALLAEALPLGASQDLIQRVAAEWKRESNI